jgi:hypothetical protein
MKVAFEWYRFNTRSLAKYVLQILDGNVLPLRELEDILLAVDDLHASVRLPLTNVSCSKRNMF